MLKKIQIQKGQAQVFEMARTMARMACVALTDRPLRIRHGCCVRLGHGVVQGISVTVCARAGREARRCAVHWPSQGILDARLTRAEGFSSGRASRSGARWPRTLLPAAGRTCSITLGLGCSVALGLPLGHGLLVVAECWCCAKCLIPIRSFMSKIIKVFYLKSIKVTYHKSNKVSYSKLK